jgi:hypothetical protein
MGSTIPPTNTCALTLPSSHAPQTPGCERVQFYMASLLATLVLDREAMSALQARGDGPPMFRTTLRQLTRTLTRLKSAKAAAAAAAAAQLQQELSEAGSEGVGRSAFGASERDAYRGAGKHRTGIECGCALLPRHNPPSRPHVMHQLCHLLATARTQPTSRRARRPAGPRAAPPRPR